MKTRPWAVRLMGAVSLFCLGPQVSAQVSPEVRQKIEGALPAKAQVHPKKTRKMLVMNLSRWGGQEREGHPSILPGNLALELLGKKTGAYEAVFSNDVENFRPDKIKAFDALCFNNTSGNLFDDAELRKSLLDFISSGKGFVGIHAAGATFAEWPRYDFWPEYGEMLGGYENGGHPWKPNETIWLKVEDPRHPVNHAFRQAVFPIADEVFQFQAPYSRDQLHVLLSIETDKTDLNPARRFLPERQKDWDFAISWVKMYGRGRVFYSSLGHNPQIYWNAPVLQHFLDGIQFALGDLKANARPSGPIKNKSAK
jgi:type 1 glutamine amidotransferase